MLSVVKFGGTFQADTHVLSKSKGWWSNISSCSHTDPARL